MIKNIMPAPLVKKTAIAVFLSITVSILLVFVLYKVLLAHYEDDTISESANHLLEISRQLKVNVEQSLSVDISRTQTLAQNINLLSFKDDDAIYQYLLTQKKTWNADSIRIYNYNGICLDENGLAQNNTLSSQFAYEAFKWGDSFHVASNLLEYGVAVNTETTVHGKKIVAVSIVHNLDKLIESMHIQSFGDRGAIYLAQQNGVKISQTINESSPSVFNITTLFEKGLLYNIDSTVVNTTNALSASSETVYLYKPNNKSIAPEYVVITPVSALKESWILLYCVPAPVVNHLMKKFSSSVLFISVIIMVLVLLLCMSFLFLYLHRELKFTKQLEFQSHIFNLLISETSMVFMLVSTKRHDPLFISSNTQALLGISNLHIDTTWQTLHFETKEITESKASEENSVIDAINFEFSKWNNETYFVSDYIPCGIDNVKKYISIRFYPVESKKHEFIGIIQDVTVEQEREDELKRALVLADSANRAKTKFLSSMSHDIRTPMNAIVNMTTFAEESCEAGNSSKTKECLSVIQESSKHLLNLINDILDMSRIESGRLSFASESFNLENATVSVADIMRPLCAIRNQKFIFENNIIHKIIIGDELRLNQVLINIVNNAVKFTPDNGTITFSVNELHSITSENASFRFSVTDTGIGIAKENLQSIFEPFTRIDNATVRKTEGTGLGLAITKRLVEAMGGSITVQSVLGKGSTFTVELFFKIDTQITLQNKAKFISSAVEGVVQTPFIGKRALLAEDNDLNRMIAHTILERWGFIIDEAVDGSDLVHCFTKQDAPHYDIIYTDIQMPIMDGYEAITQLRSNGTANASTVPVVALTADVFAEDIEKARKAGMNAHVNKPLDPATLLSVTKELLNGTGNSFVSNT